jgi:hypothetical protein
MTAQWKEKWRTHKVIASTRLRCFPNAYAVLWLPSMAFVFVLTLCQISFGTKDRFLLIPLAMTSHFLCWAQYLTKSVASGLPVYKDCELITIKSVAVLLYLPLIKSMITL